jgi:hypothetical protein
MLSDLFLLRAASTRGFRALGVGAALMLGLIAVSLSLGLLVEIGSSDQQHQKHGHRPVRPVR